MATNFSNVTETDAAISDGTPHIPGDGSIGGMMAPQQPRLLTIKQILDASLEVFGEKLGPWPHLEFITAPGDNMRAGSAISLPKEKLPQYITGSDLTGENAGYIVFAHMETEWAYFCSLDLQLPLHEFIEKHMRIPMTNLAAVCRQYFHDYRRRVVFGPLQMPCGVHSVGLGICGPFVMRGVQAYDINADRFPLRLDVLFGGI